MQASLQSSETLSWAAVALFLAATYGYLYYLKERRPGKLEEYGVQLEGLLILFKTTKFNSLMESFGRKYSHALSRLADLAFVASLGAGAYGLYFMHQNLFLLLRRPELSSPVSPLIPGVTVGLYSLPIFIIAIVVIFVPHEFMHGVVAVAERIRLRSAGLLLFLVLFGAFVEPEEEDFRKAPLRSKYRVLGAGSFANIVIAITLLALMFAVFAPQGILVTQVVEGYPAYGVLKEGDLIVAVDGRRVTTIYEFQEAMAPHGVGDIVSFTVDRGGSLVNVELRLVPHKMVPGKAVVGIVISQFMGFRGGPIPPWMRGGWMYFYQTVFWSYVLSLSVAIVNMMPIYLFDGGQVLFHTVERFLRGRAAALVKHAVASYTLGILILNIILSIAQWGLVKWLP